MCAQNSIQTQAFELRIKLLVSDPARDNEMCRAISSVRSGNDAK